MLEADPLNRKWIETTLQGKILDQFRACLVSFIAFDLYKQPKTIGTGFIIGYGENFALTVTAKHVIQKGVVDHQRPHPISSTFTLPEFIPVRDIIPDIDKGKLRATWLGEKTADMLVIKHVHYAETTDLAICILEPQEHVKSSFLPIKVNLDTSLPKVGEEICVASLTDLVSNETSYDEKTNAQTIEVGRRVTVRIGTVTEVYPMGYNQYKWPCFRTTIPIVGGMSGGLVYRSIDGGIGACGIVSADLCSPKEAFTHFTLAGDSLMACIWPILGLRIPFEISSDSITERYILDLIKSGELPDQCEDKVDYSIVDLGNGDRRIARLGN